MLGAVSLSSCLNIYGFADKPSGDEQILSAARACLNRGDFECAREHYQALSAAKNDIKVSETILTTLAENQVFSMADLINSLGSSRGGGESFAKMAEFIAARGKATRASRVLLSKAYQDANAIQSTPLKSYIQFVTSLAMFGAVLGTAVGDNNTLDLLDLVADNSCYTDGGCFGNAHCEVGNGLGLSSAITAAADMSTSVDWDTATANLGQLLGAANSAQLKLSELSSGTDSGLFQAVVFLGSIAGTAPCIRRELIRIIF